MRSARATECRTCAARLAPDQRYCLSCGTRRGCAAARAWRRWSRRCWSTRSDPTARSRSRPRARARAVAAAAPGRSPACPGPRLWPPHCWPRSASVCSPVPWLRRRSQALASAPLQLLVHSASACPNATSNSGARLGNSTVQRRPRPDSADDHRHHSGAGHSTPEPRQTQDGPRRRRPRRPADGDSGPRRAGEPARTAPDQACVPDRAGQSGLQPDLRPGFRGPYLSHALPKQGELIEDYYGVPGARWPTVWR